MGLPEGSLLTADNIVIDRDDVIRPRRGLANYGTIFPCCANVSQLFAYKKKVLAYDCSKLYFDCSNDAGCFTAFSGTYLPLESGLRIKSIKSNGNLYFTTNDGIKKISGTLDSSCNTNFTTSTNFITDAGGPKALDTTGTITYECGGFLNPLSKTAYRVVWGIRDNNQNLILGSPSSRYVIANTDCCAFANVCVTFTIPNDITSSEYFYQLYRTGIVTTCCVGCVPCLEPGDEMNLVFEAAPSSAEITAGTITIKDETPDCFRESGVLLYTNPVSGDGILQANEKPPVAKDVELFRNSVFYSNTSSVQREQFTVLSVASLVSGQSKFITGNCDTTREYTFRGSTESFTVTTVANVTDSLNGDYILMNSASNEKKYFFWFESIACTIEPCACDISGRIAVKVSVCSCDTACVVATKLNTAISANCIDFCSSVCANVISITTTKNGNVTDATNGATSPGFSFCVSAQGTGEDACCQFVLLSSLVSPAQAIDESARSLVNIINRDACGIVSAFYLSGEDDLPGLILLEGLNLSDPTFYIAVEDDCVDITGNFSPALDSSSPITAMSGLCSCTKTRVVAACHGYSVCDCVYIYDTSNCVMGKFKVIAVPCAGNFDICEAFCATSTGRTFGISQSSDNDVKPNRLYFSKTNRPEAVPLVNFLDVGGQDAEIKRIVALRDNLFILKEDGVYILTGDSGNFSVRLLDNSTFILAPDSAAVLNNQIYMLSSQGVATVSDTGIGVVSRPIEDKILGVSNERFNFKTASFGVGYESDRSYILWLPTSTSDTVATQAFRFNTFNRSWVRWTGVNARSGLINPVDDKLYISSGDSSYIRQERKNDDRTDFADRDFTLCISAQPICICSPSVELSNVCCVNIGDALVQSQFLTVSKFNRMLRKLDLDTGTSCSDYLSELEMSLGNCSAQYLLDLHTKLDADDCSVCYSLPACAPSTAEQIRQDYNTIVMEINCCSTNLQFKNYATIGACCSVEYETLITSKCVQFSSVMLSQAVPFLAGNIQQYKGISSVVTWAPQHFGDPSLLKQVSEGTIVFDGNNFFDAKVAYSSDLSKSFDERIFVGQGAGYWGGYNWGSVTWGGEGTDAPHRTLIPRQKQRCRYMTVKFTHLNAREDFTILGISLQARALSTRAYRGI